MVDTKKTFNEESADYKRGWMDATYAFSINVIQIFTANIGNKIISEIIAARTPPAKKEEDSIILKPITPLKPITTEPIVWTKPSIIPAPSEVKTEQVEQINLNGRMVGYITKGIYVSNRDTKKHFYVKGAGYPISNSVLKELKEKGVTTIRIVEHGIDVRTFEAPLERYMQAVLIQEPGFDQQRCLPLVEMTLVGSVFR